MIKLIPIQLVVMIITIHGIKKLMLQIVHYFNAVIIRKIIKMKADIMLTLKIIK